MSSDVLTLKQVLETVDTFPWTHALYADRSVSWSLDTQCMVHDPDNVVLDDDELPEIVAAAGFSDTLEIQDVKDIVSNALNQKPHALTNDLLEAFVYYIENDVFIAFDG